MLKGDLQKVYDYIEKHFEEHIEDMRQLVKQPSISFTNEGTLAPIIVPNLEVDLLNHYRA